MKIYVQVKPKSKIEKVEKLDDIHYIVYTKNPAIKGLANISTIKDLAKYFSVPKSSIEIASGFKSRNKILNITKF